MLGIHPLERRENRTIPVWGIVLTACVCAAPAFASHPDGIDLRAREGTEPGSVELAWQGGLANFEIYRAVSPIGLLDPANQVGLTGFNSWIDTPPDTIIQYYEIVSFCSPTPVEVCDGLDDDCDGEVDEAGSEASCALPNAVPACVAGSCTIGSCTTGFEDCDGNRQNGCETGITTTANCGGCGISCDDADACTGDVCSAALTCAHFDASACGVASCASGGCGFADTDGDGLNDTWEENGYIDIDCDNVQGPADAPLPNADPAIPNIYVKWDYMELPSAGTPCLAAADCSPAGQQCVNEVCTGHSHAPSAAALDLLVQAFQAQNVILTYHPSSDAIPEVRVVAFPPVSAACSGPDAVSFYDVRDAHFPPSLKPAYRYLLFSHLSTCPDAASCANCPPDPITGAAPAFGLTGLAEIPGNDLMVSFGSYVESAPPPAPPLEDRFVAGTMLHELGHGLGLAHGGGDEIRQKPNYFSVMNSIYQFGIGLSAAPGPYATTETNPAVEYRIDLSGELLGPLDECGGPGGGLNEAAGVSGGSPMSRDVTVFFADPGSIQLYAPSNSTPIDWNSNGFTGESGIGADINGDGACSVLMGHDDWANLLYGFQCTAGYDDTGPVQAGCAPPAAPARSTPPSR